MSETPTPGKVPTPSERSRANLRVGGGRPKGVPNKVTQTFRETVTKLLEDNRENVALWLKQTAEGSKAKRVGGKTIPGRAPAPAEAARLLANLAEFAAPRLSRAEVTGEGGGPLTVVVVNEPKEEPDAAD